MAAAEHAMWVTKRYPILNNRVGFVMVPDASRDALVLDGGAQDTFSGMSFINPAPAIATATFTPAAIASDAAVGSTAGSFAATGGTPPFTYEFISSPSGAFIIDGSTLKTTITPLPEGAIAFTARAKDAAGRIKPINGTVTVTAPAAPQTLKSTATPAKATTTAQPAAKK